jgi:hypothetical protein
VIQERILFKTKRINAEALMSFIGKEFGMAREEIAGGSQRRAASRARSGFC